jgi:addiction module HigA family antidote
MKNPPHPGRIIGQDCLEPLKLSVTEGARLLGVSRNSLSRVIHGHAAISAEMAIRFEKMGWGTADGWVRAQAAHDLAQARKNAGKIKVRPLKVA